MNPKSVFLFVICEGELYGPAFVSALQHPSVLDALDDPDVQYEVRTAKIDVLHELATRKEAVKISRQKGDRECFVALAIGPIDSTDRIRDELPIFDLPTYTEPQPVHSNSQQPETAEDSACKVLSIDAILCCCLTYPVAKIRVHPKLERLVVFSLSDSKVGLFGWTETGMHLISILRDVYAFDNKTIFGVTEDLRELPIGANGFIGDAAFSLTQDVIGVVGRGIPIRLYSSLEGRLVDEFGAVDSKIRVFYPTNAEIPLTIEPQHQGYSNIVFLNDNNHIVVERLFKENTSMEKSIDVYSIEDRQVVQSLPMCFDVSQILQVDHELLLFTSWDNEASLIRMMIHQKNDGDTAEKCGPVVKLSHAELMVCWPLATACGLVVHPDKKLCICVVKLNGLDRAGVFLECYEMPSFVLMFRRKLKLPDYVTKGKGDFACGCLPEHVAFDQSGDYVFVPLGDGFIEKLDTVTGLPVCLWKAHDAFVSTLCLHAASGLLFSASIDGSIKAWDVDCIDV